MNAELVAMFKIVLAEHWGFIVEWCCFCGAQAPEDLPTESEFLEWHRDHQAEQLAARLEQVGVIGPRCRASGANATLWRSWIPDDSISVFAIREEQST